MPGYSFGRSVCVFCGKEISLNGLAQYAHLQKHRREGLSYDTQEGKDAIERHRKQWEKKGGAETVKDQRSVRREVIKALWEAHKHLADAESCAFHLADFNEYPRIGAQARSLYNLILEHEAAP